MRNNPQPQEMYRHFKGNVYQVRCLAKHSETGELLVIYQAMYGDFQIYARPLSSFMDEVDREKYPDSVQRYRFELLDMTTEHTQLQSKLETDETAQTADAYLAKDYDTQEVPDIDPLVLQFLDADTYEQRLEILSRLHSRIDDEMINTMAVAVDIEIKEGDIEDRYDELKNCLLTFEKYECNRLR